MIIPYLIGFLVGTIFTLLIVSHVTGLQYQNEIKRDVLVNELLEENKKYKDCMEKINGEMNRDYWG